MPDWYRTAKNQEEVAMAKKSDPVLDEERNKMYLHDALNEVMRAIDNLPGWAYDELDGDAIRDKLRDMAEEEGIDLR